MKPDEKYSLYDEGEDVFKTDKNYTVRQLKDIFEDLTKRGKGDYKVTCESGYVEIDSLEVWDSIKEVIL